MSEVQLPKGRACLVSPRKERLKGEEEKLKSIHYNSFKILKKIAQNAFLLDLPPYLEMDLVMNVVNVNLFEPSMLDEDQWQQPVLLLAMDNLWMELEKLLADACIVEMKVTETRHRRIEFFE